VAATARSHGNAAGEGVAFGGMIESLDLDAAGLRSDEADLAARVEALAIRLEGALPGRTRVRRRSKRWVFGPKQVTEIDVSVGDTAYLLGFDGRRVSYERALAVRGIRIKREAMGARDWLAALEDQLRAEAQQSAEARAALERLLA